MPNRMIRQVIRGQRIVTAVPETTVRAASLQMREARVGAVMVVDRAGVGPVGRLLGIFTERDALFKVIAGKLDPDTTQLAEVMTPNPITIDADRPFLHALHIMNDNLFRHLPVVEGGVPVGMISARDALGLEWVEFEREQRQKEELVELLG